MFRALKHTLSLREGVLARPPGVVERAQRAFWRTCQSCGMRSCTRVYMTSPTSCSRWPPLITELWQLYHMHVWSVYTGSHYNNYHHYFCCYGNNCNYALKSFFYAFIVQKFTRLDMHHLLCGTHQWHHTDLTSLSTSLATDSCELPTLRLCSS